ncbi:hypothetical protein EV361DRAFT_918027 [Lentinula raphanica]|uniref:Uncharacterized protein n=1 Tax=Lentinula raphanica TaxID=153919 RepID=A0AA38P7F5_9AGAR|nr:hypothetical protein F5880DRAFT_1702758 [Lentinula raphanica]KAJ3837709.1 hypothetical protein F5878DRAFT_661866 [Lentinula raphanica]KAJ3970040.1 hypothetical protein EV361DRAFT_918027 [Lentinula raphanica]
MLKNLRLNSLRGALIIVAFSSALGAPISMSASDYARDLSNQLEPVNAPVPVPGPHLAARTPGLNFTASVQEVQSISPDDDDKDWDRDTDNSDKPHIFVRQAPDEHHTTPFQRAKSSNVMLHSAQEWKSYAEEVREGRVLPLEETRKRYLYKVEHWRAEGYEESQIPAATRSVLAKTEQHLAQMKKLVAEYESLAKEREQIEKAGQDRGSSDRH